MADVKISALPLASTPLAGTEVLPIVQSATTDQVSVANLTAGRSVSAASLTLTTTPLAVGSGGTGLNSLTAGYIPFGAGTGAFGNSANLFWDNTNARLGIGTATPSQFIHLYNASNDVRALIEVASTGKSPQLQLKNAAGETHTIGSETSSGNAAFGGSTAYGLEIFAGGTTRPIQFGVNSNVAMTLDASGNLGIGAVATAGYQLDVVGSIRSTNGTSFVGQNSTNTGANVMRLVNNSGSVYFGVDNSTGGAYGTGTAYSAFIYTNYSAPICFISNSTERARIDSSGNLLVGTTSAVLSGKITVQYNGASARGISLDNTYNGTINAVSCSYNGTYVGGLTSSATATALVTSSDISLKENIVPALSSLASILALPIRQFDWKSDGSHTDYGVVAQEANDFAPEMVTKGELWSVDYGRITPRLIKAIQELAAKVTALEAKQ